MAASYRVLCFHFGGRVRAASKLSTNFRCGIQRQAGTLAASTSCSLVDTRGFYGGPQRGGVNRSSLPGVKCNVISPGGSWCSWLQTMQYSSANLTLDELKRRVLDVCRAFDKISADKLTEDSHFMNDLGLDSLDQVELVMAMEDEFGFEIPDSDAEKLVRPSDVIKYVAEKENIHQ